MTPRDLKLLNLQFQNKIYSLAGIEFQHFVESVFEKSYPDFVKVKPDGRKGDGGNDGFRTKSGIFYAMYSPEEPRSRYKDAGEKFKDDFEKLMGSGWDELNEMKEFHFIFNDHFKGTTQELCNIRKELQKNYPRIKIELVLAHELEKIFFELNEDDLTLLGFDCDASKTASIAREFINRIETFLSREEIKNARLVLDLIYPVIPEIDESSIKVEIELLNCEVLIREERIEEARAKLNALLESFPTDPRAYISLIDLYFQEGNTSKGIELLQKVEQSTGKNDYLALGFLLRDLSIDDGSNHHYVDEQQFPEDAPLRADFFRLHGLWFLKQGELNKASRFLNESVKLAPNTLINRIALLQLLLAECYSCKEDDDIIAKAGGALDYIKRTQEDFDPISETSLRRQLILLEFERQLHWLLDDGDAVGRLADEALRLSIQCHWDRQIEEIISSVLQNSQIDDGIFNELKRYLIHGAKPITVNLINSLLLHFSLRCVSLSEMKLFFELLNHDLMVEILDSIEKSELDKVIEYLKENQSLGLILAATLKGNILLRGRIIGEVLTETHAQSDFLYLLLSIEQDDFDKAYDRIKHMDLSILSPLQLYQIEEVVHRKNAWEAEIRILTTLLSTERNERNRFSIKLRLLRAYGNLKKYREVIELGKELLKQNTTLKVLDDMNTENLLRGTIYAMNSRVAVNPSLHTDAIDLIEEYEPKNSSFEFRVIIKAPLYIKNNDTQLGIETVVNAYKAKRSLSSNDYIALYSCLLDLSNRSDYNFDSLGAVEDGCFVKLDARDDWYCLGDSYGLVPLEIKPSNSFYSELVGKRRGDIIQISAEFSTTFTQSTIETIFSIDKYIFWQVKETINKLAEIDGVPGLTKIETPIDNGTIDLSSLIKYFETFNKSSMAFFAEYQKNPIPLAFLAISEGGLLPALGRIQRERKGFVNATRGLLEENSQQISLVNKVIDGETAFYIDGSSAYFLARFGILPKIKHQIKNVRVPQSVVNFLLQLASDYSDPYRVGYLNYIDGAISFSEVNSEMQKNMMAQMIELITFFESEGKNIDLISSANKLTVLTETKVPSELCDACLLAQQKNLPIMTEDFNYLYANHFDTGKEVPEHFSIVTLIRVLYERRILSSTDYFDCLGLLAHHRFKFIHLTSKDLNDVVFGDSPIVRFHPKDLQKLNLPLLLSEEYGADFRISVSILFNFLYDVITDYSVNEKLLEEVFVEIIEVLPNKWDKYFVGNLLLRLSLNKNEKTESLLNLELTRKTIQAKISRLTHILELYKNLSKLVV